MESEEIYMAAGGLGAGYAVQKGAQSARLQNVPEGGPPITQLTLAHINATNQQLMDFVGRLDMLRDRLFGSSVNNARGGDASRPSAGSFTDAFAVSAQETHALLAQLDKLTYELSNRL